MEKKYNKRERRAIYEQMAIDFETGVEYMGLCKAFSKLSKIGGVAYRPSILVSFFPELEVFFGEKDAGSTRFISDEDGRPKVYGNFHDMNYSGDSAEDRATRVSILTLCAEMCK